MHAPKILSPETQVLDQLRARWLADIDARGAVSARLDAIEALSQRMRCTRLEAESFVERAWSMLHLFDAVPMTAAR